MIFWGLFYISIGGLLLGVGLFIEHILNNKKVGKMLSVLFVFSVMFALASIKGINVGRDTQAYIQAYNYLANSGWSIIKYRSFEIGFSLFMKVFGKMHAPYQVFAFFLYFIVFASLGFSTYKLSKNPSVVGFVYFALIFPFGLSAQRQILAASIFTLSLMFLSKKGIKNALFYALFIIIASFFHITTLAGLLLLPLKKIKISNIAIGWLSFFLVVFYVVSTPIYQVFVYNFAPSSYYPTSAGRGLLFWAMFIIFITIYLFGWTNIPNTIWNKLTKKGDSLLIVSNSAQDKMFLLSSALALFFLSFIPVSDVFPRFYFTFGIGFCFLFAMIFSQIVNKKHKIIFVCLLFILCSLLMFFESVRGNGLDIWPYRTCF